MIEHIINDLHTLDAGAVLGFLDPESVNALKLAMIQTEVEMATLRGEVPHDVDPGA